MAAFTAMALIGMGVGMYTQFRSGQKAASAAEAQGQAQREAAESQAQLAEWNAEVAGLQQKDAIARGAEEEQRFRTGVRGLIGSQRAAFAGSGVDVGFGSAVDVQADAAFLGELDALTIRTNAAREAWGYQVQGEDLQRRAAVARREGHYFEAAGREAASAARWQTGSTLLSSGSSLLMQTYGPRQPRFRGTITREY